MDIAKRIKDIREGNGWSQKDVAEIIGLETPNYARYERKGEKLTIEQLKQIASALRVTIKDILFNEASSTQDIELEKLNTENELLKSKHQIADNEIARLKADNEVKRIQLEFIAKMIKSQKIKLDTGIIDLSLETMQELKAMELPTEGQYNTGAIYLAFEGIQAMFKGEKKD